MILVKLQGGLGNQMFQYATARALARQKKIYFDLSFLKQNPVSTEYFTARKFELAIFSNLRIEKGNHYLIKFLLTKNKLANIFKKYLFNPFFKIESINDDNINKALALKKNNFLYLDGYFQNPKHLNKIRNELLKDFEFPELPNNLSNLLNEVESKNSVSIHVRRGDYLKPEINAYHGILPLEYYHKAVLKIAEKVEDPVFYIFSDDIEWCRKHLIYSNIESHFIDNENRQPWMDMNLMSRCKHHIIANSSFSWWSAWLNNQKDKIVIAPLNWYNEADTQIIPRQWILL